MESQQSSNDRTSHPLWCSAALFVPVIAHLAHMIMSNGGERMSV